MTEAELTVLEQVSDEYKKLGRFLGMERDGINESRKYRVRNRCGCRGGRGSLHGSGWGARTELDTGLQSK